MKKKLFFYIFEKKSNFKIDLKNNKLITKDFFKERINLRKFIKFMKKIDRPLTKEEVKELLDLFEAPYDMSNSKVFVYSIMLFYITYNCKMKPLLKERPLEKDIVFRLTRYNKKFRLLNHNGDYFFTRNGLYICDSSILLADTFNCMIGG